MLVSKKHRKLILNLEYPEKVTNVIPTANVLSHKGHVLTAVPHRSQEVRLLSNLGFAPPSPMDYYYGWPINPAWSPWEHQKDTAKFLASYSRAYCLNGMGTAKTLSSLWAYDYLRSEGVAKKLLVVAPLSTVDDTWYQEIVRNFIHLHAVVLHGSKARRLSLLEHDVDVFIINHDGVKVIADELQQAKFDCIIIDELSQAARNASTARWKTYKKLVTGVPYVWGMTATPIPNDPSDAWAQCRLLTPETVPAYFTHFRDQVMQQVSQFRWVPRPNALDVVHRAMQPGIRFTRDECLQLPPTVYETRRAELTKIQSAMYKGMVDTLHAEHRQGEVTAVNEGVKTMKLVQIACGAVYGDDGKTITATPKPRLRALFEFVQEADSKVIVFVPFRSALSMVADVLSKAFDVAQVHGGVSKRDRDVIFSNFRTQPKPHIIVAQPKAMSHGLNLTSASTVVWFAPITSPETYEQANGRIARPGQKHTQVIAHLQGTDLETRMYQRLKQKTSTQGVLLDMFTNNG